MYGEMHQSAGSEENGPFSFLLSRAGMEKITEAGAKMSHKIIEGPTPGKVCRSGWLRLHTPDFNKGYSCNANNYEPGIKQFL